MVNVWIHHEHFQVQHMNPAWFIPAVGNVLVPVAGVPLGYVDVTVQTPHRFQAVCGRNTLIHRSGTHNSGWGSERLHVDVSWFFFSIGMLFWLILLTIIFNRVLFHHPIEARLMPTLFILIAPPAVGFIAYTRLVDGIDPFARVLYFSGLFLTLLLFTQAGRFLKLGFFLSWWAYSFPLAAISIASLLMFEQTGQDLYRYLGMGLLTLLTAIVALLLVQTARAVIGRRICLPGH